jgi:hypothetical protein
MVNEAKKEVDVDKTIVPKEDTLKIPSQDKTNRQQKVRQ